MSWRTVVITRRCKLDLSLNHLQIRGEETRRIHLSEIAVLIIESTAVSMTAALLAEMTRRNIKVIFCDERRNPQAELLPYYGTADASAKSRQQARWPTQIKDELWTQIIVWKIRKQQELLRHIGQAERADRLGAFARDVLIADANNREGAAARVYFGGLFGADFTRADDSPVNAALNYGYTILLSAFNREIVANGYLTQYGVFHDNMFNCFNLASDFMEPFRPIVDRQVYRMKPQELDHDAKMQLVDVLNHRVEIDGSTQYLVNAIRIYCRSAFNALNEKDVSELKMYGAELK